MGAIHAWHQQDFLVALFVCYRGDDCEGLFAKIN